MKHLRILIVSVFLVLAPLSSGVLAQDFGSTDEFCAGEGAGTAVCDGYNDGRQNDPIAGNGSIFNTIIDLIVWVVAIASVFGIIIGGYRYLFSSGDPQKTAGARQMIIYSLVGLGVAVMAGAIVALVLGRL